MLTYTGHIRAGKYLLDRAGAMRDEAVALIGEGGSFVLTIEPLPPGPSNSMHRYYRGVVLFHIIAALNDAGNALDNTAINRLIVHDQMKAALLPHNTALNPKTGEVVTGPTSTAVLSRERFGRYISDLVDLCRCLLNYEVPPAPVDWLTVDEVLAAKELIV